MSVFRLVCTCGSSARCVVSDQAPPGIDPKALALRKAARQGWMYRGGRMGKSVITVVCPKCRDPLLLEADVAPADVTPSTHAEDVATVGATEDSDE